MVGSSVWKSGGRTACEFVLYPSRFLGAGWREVLELQNLPLEQFGWEAHRWTSRHLSKKLDLQDLDDSACEDRLLWAIILLPPERLDNFVCHMGATLVANEIRQALMRSDIDAYRAAIGEQLYMFVMHRITLFGISNTCSGQQHGPHTIMSAIRQAGRWMLQHWCNSLCNHLWTRVQLKLPFNKEGDGAQELQLDMNEVRRRALLVMRDVETEWMAQWVHSMVPD